MGGETDIVCVEDLLKREEGCKLRPYRCPAGKLTIGYGHNLDDTTISQDDAVHILETDVAVKTQDAVKVIGEIAFRNLDEVRQAVLISMAFQMGRTGLGSFRQTLECVRRGDYDQAARNMFRSQWARQTPGRARRAAKMMYSGQWPTEEDFA
jgi:lysozyme